MNQVQGRCKYLVEPRIVEDIDAPLVDKDRAVAFGGGEGSPTIDVLVRSNEPVLPFLQRQLAVSVSFFFFYFFFYFSY